MKSFILFALSCGLVYGQTGLKVLQSSPTQALVQYDAPQVTVCTLQASKSATLAPLAYDVDGTEFAGSANETGHILKSWNTTTGNQTRVIRIGKRTSEQGTDGYWRSRALANDTQYYLTVTCGGTNASAVFRTATLSGLNPEPYPSDNTAPFGNAAFPEFDFSSPTTPVVDPQTGNEIYAADPQDWSSRQTMSLENAWVLGGTGWTNPTNAANYSDPVNSAITTNTNPLILIPNYHNLTGGGLLEISGNWPYYNYNDLGIDIYGSGTGTTVADRSLDICISIDSGQTCYTNTISVDTLSSSYANLGAHFGTNNAPAAYYRGWSKRIPRKAWPRPGIGTVSGGVLTLTGSIPPSFNAIGGTDSVGVYFDMDWPVNTKIWVSGSSPTCTNNFCTIATVDSPTQLHTVENVTVGGIAGFLSANLALIVNKHTSVGAISLTARMETALSFPQDVWDGGCALKTVVAGDGITGYPCLLPTVRQDVGALYFLGVSSPVIRLVSSVPVVGSGPDAPLGTYNRNGPHTYTPFDSTDPSYFYQEMLTNAGPLSIFKIHYTGNWTAQTNNRYAGTGINVSSSSGEITWTNLTPASTGHDVNSQVAANVPSYNAAVWGPVSPVTLGVSGPDLIVQSIVAQNGPCWLFAFNTTTGLFDKSFNSADGSTQFGHYGGCHSVQAIPGPAAGALVANDNLVMNNSAVPYGGPFQTPIVSKLKSDGVTFDAVNTGLVYPTDATDFRVCPGNAPQWAKDNGAVGNQCAVLIIKEPCSAFPTGPEKTASPCPWDGTKSTLGPPQPSDTLKDAGVDLDAESLTIVDVTASGACTGCWKVTVQRDGAFSYCSNPPRDGVNNPARNAHANGWSATAAPYQVCAASQQILDFSTGVHGTIYEENQNLYRGHFEFNTPSAKTFNWIGVSDPFYMIRYNTSWQNMLSATDLTTQAFQSLPAFAGARQTLAGIQSYVKPTSASASNYAQGFVFDFRHYNGNTGQEIEVPNQSIGTAYTLTLQGGTTGVYKVSAITGSADIKHMPLTVWAGDKMFSDMSSAATGNQITDSNQWKYCYAYFAGECRSGSSLGDFFIAGKSILSTATICWASQANQRIPCVFGGPVNSASAVQLNIASPDHENRAMRTLGHLMMIPAAQYVYSDVLPTPDGSYLYWGGYLTSGYHTGMMYERLSPFPNDSIARNTFEPVTVQGTCQVSCYAEFGYLEFGDGITHFNCTSRNENCRVAASVFLESAPFTFASESLTPHGAGAYTFTLPGIPGRLMMYRIMDNGVQVVGPTPVIVP